VSVKQGDFLVNDDRALAAGARFTAWRPSALRGGDRAGYLLGAVCLALCAR